MVIVMPLTFYVLYQTFLICHIIEWLLHGMHITFIYISVWSIIIDPCVQIYMYVETIWDIYDMFNGIVNRGLLHDQYNPTNRVLHILNFSYFPIWFV